MNTNDEYDEQEPGIAPSTVCFITAAFLFVLAVTSNTTFLPGLLAAGAVGIGYWGAMLRILENP